MLEYTGFTTENRLNGVVRGGICGAGARQGLLPLRHIARLSTVKISIFQKMKILITLLVYTAHLGQTQTCVYVTVVRNLVSVSSCVVYSLRIVVLKTQISYDCVSQQIKKQFYDAVQNNQTGIGHKDGSFTNIHIKQRKT